MKQDTQDMLVDIFAWTEETQEHLCDLWAAIEPAMSDEIREHYESAISNITKSQTAIENALGGFAAIQLLLNDREGEVEMYEDKFRHLSRYNIAMPRCPKCGRSDSVQEKSCPRPDGRQEFSCGRCGNDGYRFIVTTREM